MEEWNYALPQDWQERMNQVQMRFVPLSLMYATTPDHMETHCHSLPLNASFTKVSDRPILFYTQHPGKSLLMKYWPVKWVDRALGLSLRMNKTTS